MRSLSLAVLAVVLVCVVAAIAVACAVPPRETYREIIDERQAPQIEGLAERAGPEQKTETATEAFWDLLKLRDFPQAAAVPELVKILEAHDNSNRIHRFASAQALFTADGDDARRALEKRLLTPEFPAGMAINFSTHWQMPEPQRSRFIETYLHKNLADDLGVSVDARWVAGDTAKLMVTVTLANKTERVIAVRVPEVFRAMTLQFRSTSGRFAPQATTVIYRLAPPRAKRLQPGGSTSYDVPFELDEGAEALAKSKRLSTERIKAVLKTQDVDVALSELGRYQVSAMIEQPPLDKELQKRLDERDGIEPGIFWTGRAVSKPVEVEVGGG